MRKLLCWLGFHKYKERLCFTEPDVWEHYCIHCDYSPTWER